MDNNHFLIIHNIFVPDLLLNSRLHTIFLGEAFISTVCFWYPGESLKSVIVTDI